MRVLGEPLLGGHQLARHILALEQAVEIDQPLVELLLQGAAQHLFGQLVTTTRAQLQRIGLDQFRLLAQAFGHALPGGNHQTGRIAVLGRGTLPGLRQQRHMHLTLQRLLVFLAQYLLPAQLGQQVQQAVPVF